jgi:cysteine desulfurase
MARIYLDNNATTQPDERVLAAMQQAYRELWANPSSVHRFGQLVRHNLELARQATARLIGCRDRELVFTSGGTESNNLALRGVLGPGRAGESARVLITTDVEHAAVREPGEALAGYGVEVVKLPVDGQGQLDPGVLAGALRQYGGRGGVVLVSVQWVNNETGVIQPIAELAACCRAAGQEHAGAGTRVLLHSDATQAVGKMAVDVGAAGLDLMTLVGHKFHGPKGVGALFVRSGVKLRAQNLGGPQERQRRGGTEDAPGIIALGVAAQLAEAFLADAEALAPLAGLRDRFEQGVRAALPETVVNGGGAARRIWNTSNLGFPGLEAEAIVLGLSERGLCVSAGAACSSGSLEPSPVLRAMGVPEEVAHGSIRFSLSRHTTAAELGQAVTLVAEVVSQVRRALPLGT